MEFIEIEPGITIHIDAIKSFIKEDSGTRVYFDMERDNLFINTDYELFKSLINVKSNRLNQIARNLKTLSQSAFTPTP